MTNKKNSSILSGLFWTFGERIIAQLVSLIVTIILARLLSPEHYGVISIVTVFITFCNIFVNSGFGSAVVQKKQSDDLDFNTAFVISLLLSIILYIIIFICSPFLADFYDMPLLTSVIRVMGLRLIIGALNNIQHAHIQKKMMFKKFFISTLFGTIISAFVGIALAFYGFGVWALVAQYLTNTVIDSIALLIVDDWKPKLSLSLKRAKYLFSFGWKILVTEIVYNLEGELRSLIVGKVFGSADLAYYDQGKKYPSLLVTNINSSINKVMLPAYSKEQDNKEKIKSMLRKSIQLGIFLLCPLLIGLAVVSNDFVRLFLTDKWLNAVPFIQIFCIIYLTRPLESSCHQALLAIGQSGIVMKIIIAINCIAIATIFIAVFVFKSVFMIAIGSLLSSFISITLFMKEANKYFKYTYKEQLSDIYKPILLSVLMGLIVWLVGIIKLPVWISLMLQIVAGAIVYIGISIIGKFESYLYIKNKLLSFMKKSK